MGKGEKFSVEGDPHVYPPSPKPIPHFKDFQHYRIPDEGWFYGWKRGACRFCLKRQECIYTFALPGDESLRTDTARFPLPSLPLAKVLGGRGEAFEEGRGDFCPERSPLPSSRLNSFQPYPRPTDEDAGHRSTRDGRRWRGRSPAARQRGTPLTRASTSTPGPIFSMSGARMNTASRGG